jgi:hypothetical protein
LASFEEIKANVEAQQDVLTVRMSDLRDAYGVRRLGVHVCQEISNKLRGVGLGHFPELQPDAWQSVRLHKLGTPMSDLLNAANHAGEDGDKVLRELAEGDARAVVREIRALVCE